jgi:small subunit ribosomal protein S17
MTDDEQKKDEAVDETPDQGSDESTAGPDAASEGSAGGGEASVLDPSESAPPAEETPEPEAEESKDETAEAESSDEPEAEQEESEVAAEPAAEEAAPAEEAAEESEEDQLPWKEKRRLERSRQPHKPGPARTPEERAAERAQRRKSKAGMRRKERTANKQGKTAGTGTPVAEKESVAAKTRQGIVVSNKGEKSITVRIDIARRHPTYEKVVRRSRTLHAHDERNEAGEGDVVRIVETRPLSKTKRWRLVEVLERAK